MYVFEHISWGNQSYILFFIQTSWVFSAIVEELVN